MDRKNAKALLPIIKAYAEGKELQIKSYTGKWEDLPSPSFNNAASEYRIKPKVKYRPFKDADECWNEILKHQPFGWIKNNVGYEQISSLCDVKDEDGGITIYAQQKNWSCKFLFKTFTFADGTPFGIKEGGEE